jgi:hypothetical protein
MYRLKLFKRERHVSLRERALKKLTAAERNALGFCPKIRPPRITKKRNR